MRIHYGAYTLDANRHEMRKGEESIHLSPKAMRLLQLLAERHPSAVSKEEIFDVVWPGTFVTEANLPILVNEIRSALGDDARKPRVIRTVFGFGYALGDDVRVEKEVARAAFNSIAVLPIQNRAGAEWADVSEGMTEHLINALARTRRYKVIPRSTVFRFANLETESISIAKKLGVDCVVTGRLRVRGDEIIAQIEMIDARDESQLWGERYQRRASEVLELQNQIAAEILARLNVESAPSPAPTEDAEAYRMYLRGRYQWNRRTAESLRQAIESFESAAARDSRFALAHAAVAETYVALGTRDVIAPREIFPKAKEAALHALEIDPSIAAAHTAVAGVQELFEWEWTAAEQSHKRAISLDPQYATAAQWFALHLARRGQQSEAEEWIGKALDLEPASAIINTNAALIAYLGRNFARASELASAATSLDPNHEGARVITGLIWIQTDIAKAIEHFEETLRFGAVPHVVANLAYAYARTGRLDDARRLEREISASSSSYVSAANRAVISLGLGDEEQTLDHLEKAAAARSPWLTYLKSEPRFDAIRRHDRFQSVIEMIGL